MNENKEHPDIGMCERCSCIHCSNYPECDETCLEI